MPREYKRKTEGTPVGGRPPIDDRPVARGVLLAILAMGRDRQDAIRGGASVLMDRRATTDKPIKLRRNAVQRVGKEVQELEVATSSHTTDSILDVDALGRHLRRTHDYDLFVRFKALEKVERLLRVIPGLAERAEADAALRRRIAHGVLKRARREVPDEFVPIP
jgi:hypothetical protein